MKLVIVESPAKSKTIGRYLGEGYQVEASVGHIRDLATSGKGGLGVDVENDFKPTYIISKDKRDVVKKLKDIQKKADEVILATDPDREGEAIAWHLAQVLELDVNKTKRLEFHEITNSSINKAIENPRTINMDLVHSQEARRIIDRIIGFKISNLIYSRIKSKSAGRVQSVTLKLICDHEKEINDFKPEEYWTIEANIELNGKKYKLSLYKVDGKAVKVKNKEEAEAIAKRIGKNVIVEDIIKTQKHISAKEALITSTMQQEAYNAYKFKTKETTFLAQKLYEGVEIDEGLVGLITYIRTDSTKLSDTFISAAKTYIEDTYGKDFYKGEHTRKKVALSQDAHEAIRQTSIERTPSLMKNYLTDHEYKLYKLIYNRAIASLMSDKEVESTSVIFETNGIEFKLEGSVITFKGYDILNLDSDDVDVLPSFTKGDNFNLIDLENNQHFTKAPARYNEGKLVKLMQDEGIGRPSTYASTIQTLVTRKYIISGKDGVTPTEQGEKTATVLTKYFPDLMSTEYTASMETNLDKISDGEEEEVKVIKDFYEPFIVHFEETKGVMYKDPLEYTGENCPLCGSPLVYRVSRNGKFVGCSNYPKCKYIKKEPKEPPKEVGRNCPDCGSPLVYRKNKRGQEFIGCSNYPSCHYLEGLEKKTVEEDTGEKRICPKCGGVLVKRSSKRGSFYGCSNYPKCKYIEPIEKKK
ncbi:MAG: type I DNA topoisomerase [Bacilli bacterium]